MTEAEFQVLYDEYYVKRRVVQGIARKLAKTDPDLYEDLIQVGLFTLWKLDLSKANKNKDSWIRQAMKFKMINQLISLDPRKYTSLDAQLERGIQLEVTEDGIRFNTRCLDEIKTLDANDVDGWGGGMYLVDSEDVDNDT